MGKEYNSFVESFMRNYDGKNNKIVKYLLESDDAKDSYLSIEGKIPEAEINELFEKTAKNVKESTKPDEFVSELGRNVANIGRHDDIIEDFFKKGLIGEEQYIKSKKDAALNRSVFTWDLRGIMVLSFFISSLFLIKSLSNGGFIGAVIGVDTVDLNAIYGTIFLLLGLAIAHFIYKME